MSGVTMLYHLRREGLSLFRQGDRVVVESDTPLTDEQRALIWPNKSALLAALLAEEAIRRAAGRCRHGRS